MPDSAPLYPNDELNQALLANVHPSDWKNPEPAARYNLVVIGAGTAGLVTAAGAAGLGARVALVERYLMGGDCLNVGCVPSKAIVRSSRLAADLRDAEKFGVRVPQGAKVDFAAVMARMRHLRARLSPHDSARRFQELGVDVFLGDARFSGPDTVEVDGKQLRFKKAVIATGAQAVVPPIEGLAEAGFFTNETIFNLTEQPRRLVALGGGPIGCELAQAFCRMGCEVTMVEMQSQFLPRWDPQASRLLEKVLIREGIEIRMGTRLRRVTKSGNEKVLHLESGDREEVLKADAILVGVGRAPNVEGLNLESAGVNYSKEGVIVNDRLQTANPRIFAAGDVCLQYKFTHTADAYSRTRLTPFVKQLFTQWLAWTR